MDLGKEFLDTSVITTKYVLDIDSPILFVFHHTGDGWWSFHGDEENEQSDARVVTFERMLEIDPSLMELIGLECGSMARRVDRDSDWIIECFDE